MEEKLRLRARRISGKENERAKQNRERDEGGWPASVILYKQGGQGYKTGR